ncbi:archaeal conserved hypothetical protein [Thermoplasmatales archaeon BRNA1]|nr:archaeal conserved hypothetical protein [Thermoplasmatales archaeon BRNA1]
MVGKSFVYLGPDRECKFCQLKGICFNLEKGSMYRVKSLRKTTHQCEATEGTVHVVEVEKVSREAAVEKKYAIEGSTVTFACSGCGNIGCPSFKLCNPEGMEDEEIRVELLKVGEKIDCPIGESRNRVTIL